MIERVNCRHAGQKATTNTLLIPTPFFQMISAIIHIGRMLRGYATFSRFLFSALGIFLATLFASGGQKRVSLWSGCIHGLGSHIGRSALAL